MTKPADASRRRRSRTEKPLSHQEILLRENVPASEPAPADFKTYSSRSIVVQSEEKDFDPRKYFTKVEGSRGLWEFSTTETVLQGLPIQRTGSIKPGSLSRGQRIRSSLQAFRPPWQPYVFHPKTLEPQPALPVMRRKRGDRVQPSGIVFNRDDRELFYPQGFPWQCVGRLLISSLGSGLSWGTATLVGRRAVLTAAHVIPWGAPGLVLIFVPAYWNWPFPWTPLTPVVPPPLQLASIATDVWGYREGGANRQAYDLAVLRLRDPLGDMLGYFGATVYDDDWEDDTRWTLVGYPGLVNVAPGTSGYNNNGNMPTRQFGISVEDDDSDGDALELEHRADCTSGNSGGPLFGYWPDGPHVIGVHSGNTDSTNVAAGGNAMVALVKWARSNWG
jgi:Trypsin-like peptidase domain